METAQNLIIGKNALWAAYQNAEPLIHDEILRELKKLNLYRHFQTVSSREGYDLVNKLDQRIKDIFFKYMPETAPLYGMRTRRSKSERSPMPAPLFDEPTSQPQS